MGITHAAVHLPLHTLSDKQLRASEIADGHDALRVPWWDEDPLTLAIEAGLKLGDRVEAAEQILVALDEPTGAEALVPLALDLSVPTALVSGVDAGLEALVSGDEGPALLVAGGERLGGAGVAVLIEEDAGVEVVDAAASYQGPLDGRQAAALQGALESTEGEGPAIAPLPRMQRGWLPEVDRSGIATRVGDSGAACALIEMVAYLAEAGGPVKVLTGEAGQALAVAMGEGSLDVIGLDEQGVGTTVQAWVSMAETEFEPWAEASQGAYVSSDEYEADIERRYGARTTGPGTVEAVTTIAAGPPGEFLRQHEAAGPYDVAIVQLVGGDRAIGQSALPPGRLSIGDPVVPIVRRVFTMEGKVRYGLKWKG